MELLPAGQAKLGFQQNARRRISEEAVPGLPGCVRSTTDEVPAIIGVEMPSPDNSHVMCAPDILPADTTPITVALRLRTR